MSHLAELQTKVYDLNIVKAACDHLGIPWTQDVKTVKTFYAQDAKGTKHFPVELVLGYKEWSYNLGFRKAEDGSYTLVGDNYDMAGQTGWRTNALTGLSGREVLRLIGPDMEKFETRTINGLSGHYMTGKPTSLLMEYALQTGLVTAAQFGMNWERLPADAEEDDAPQGGEKIVLTGGYLPPHMSMHLIACPDGTCRVRFDNGGDLTVDCYEMTKPLEDALGALLTDTDLTGLDTVHQVQQGRRTHVQRTHA